MDQPPILPRNVSLVHNMADFAAFLDVLGYSFDADLERLKAQTREGQPWDEGDLTNMFSTRSRPPASGAAGAAFPAALLPVPVTARTVRRAYPRRKPVAQP
jgi:hypothetical protein